MAFLFSKVWVSSGVVERRRATMGIPFTFYFTEEVMSSNPNPWSALSFEALVTQYNSTKKYFLTSSGLTPDLLLLDSLVKQPSMEWRVNVIAPVSKHIFHLSFIQFNRGW